MFDIKWIRDNAAKFDERLAVRGLPAAADALIKLDEERRRQVTALNDIQARRNAASKEIGKAKATKDETTASALMAEVAALKDALAAGEEDVKRLDAELQKALEVIPNLPRDDVPVGADEHANKEMRKVGDPKTFAYKPLQHFELGEGLGLMDFETAAKVSGARFVFLKGDLARLERAIGCFMLDLHTTEFGYTEVNPPLLVRNAAAYGTGNLPKFADDLFVTSRSLNEADAVFEQLRIEGFQKAKAEVREMIVRDVSPDVAEQMLTGIFERLKPRWKAEFDSEVIEHLKLYLIPTAEVSLTNMVRESILSEDKLPMRLTAWTPCFRSEAGSAGRDVRGMIRQHQFSKVELVSITTPEKSLEEHERMTSCAEEVLKRLGLPFRTMLLCTGDMGFASQKTYDIEVWLPGQNAYREISSCSVCGDFQARRMNARYRPAGSKTNEFVHTLNGSGLAVGRTMVAILENYQQPDGSVAIPEVLRGYMGGKQKIEAHRP
jgi:seryl-tRNA synthetase